MKRFKSNKKIKDNLSKYTGISEFILNFKKIKKNKSLVNFHKQKNFAGSYIHELNKEKDDIQIIYSRSIYGRLTTISAHEAYKKYIKNKQVKLLYSILEAFYIKYKDPKEFIDRAGKSLLRKYIFAHSTSGISFNEHVIKLNSRNKRKVMRKILTNNAIYTAYIQCKVKKYKNEYM